MRKSRRPYVRHNRARVESEQRGDAARLAHLAGSSRSAVEPLEARKLLFSLTITSADDAADGVVDGYGTITRTWGYVVPFLALAQDDIPEPVEDELLSEDFDDEEGADPGENVPSGATFNESNIQITHNMNTITWAADAIDPEDLDLRVAFTVANALSEFVTFTFRDDEGNTNVAKNATFTFEPTDIPSLDPATGIQVELLVGGEVVETLSGADLALTGPDNNQLALQRVDGFDSVRFTLLGIGTDFSFVVDQIDAVFSGGRFKEFFAGRDATATFVLRAPVGATIHVVDLYGREMVLTPDIGEGAGNVAPVDPDDNGVPNHNDGIGFIDLTGTDLNSTFNIYGNFSEPDEPTIAENTIGIFDVFDEMRFGYQAVFTDDTLEIYGLPLGTGSVVIGSPFIRDNSSPAAYFSSVLDQIVPDNFSRANQGIHVLNASIGSVTAHAVLHGQSTVEGAAGRFNVGYLPGSLSVEGDLGALHVASDAARWVGFQDVVNSTGGVLSVGRTVGQIAIGGASFMDVTVIGDVNNPNRPVVDFLTYNEQEVVYGFDPATDQGERVANRRTLLTTDPAAQAVIFGPGFLRNDTINSAEYVGYNGAAVFISGELGLADPYNTGSDPSDVYAFATDGTTDVVVEVTFGLGQNFDQAMARIVDRNGVVVASHNHPFFSVFPTPEGGVQFRFRPDGAGVYYLVIAAPVDGGAGFFATSLTYTATLSGIAPTTLGQHRTGGGLSAPTVASNLITVQAGAAGLISVGSGFVVGDGSEDAGDSVTSFGRATIDSYNHLSTVAISVASHLYAIHTGSDVESPTINIGGNLGVFATGRSALIGGGPIEGDIAAMLLNVGGQVGVFEIAGNLAWDQDGPMDAPPGGPTRVVIINTGTAGGPGHIGQILVGGFVNGGEDTPDLIINTSPGSVIGMFRVGAIGGDAGQNGNIEEGIPRFRLGTDSDIRFVDFDVLDSDNDPDALRFIGAGQSFQLTDDAGATVTIRIVGGIGTASGAFIRFLPIDGSQGVAIARIDATLLGGAVLSIVGNTPGRVSIGTINITTDGTTDVLGNLQSALRITGASTEIDVWRVQVLGAPLGLIENRTPNGDIVMIDAAGLDRLLITGGNLGRTETVGIGPKLYGAFLGIGDAGSGVGGPLGFNFAGNINRAFTGIFIPANQPTANPDEAFLEDLGAPFDAFLNGLVVRDGDVSSITVSGAVGDVIVQNGALVSLIANSDGQAPFGAFHGIVGTIYATTITTIDVGDGVAEAGPSPFAAAGIFSDGDITTVTTRATLAPVISGPIVAGVNSTVGIDNIILNNGRIDGAFIGVSNFDAFWVSARYLTSPNPDAEITFGLLNRITGTNSDMFGSRILATDVNIIMLTGGAYDATEMSIRGFINQVIADEFRNSTLLGDPLEFRRNRIDATGNIGRLETTGGLGDIADLEVDILGSITGGVLARNFIRTRLDVDNEITRITINNDIRGSQIITGELGFVAVTSDIRSSEFLVSGPVTSITANNMTSVLIDSTGPDGRIGAITAQFFLTGDIRASGPITTISSVFGDIIGSVTTTDFDGTLMTLSAGNDLIVALDISADAQMIHAGRHIGRQGEVPADRAIFIRGNLNTIETPNGQIYTALRVGEAVTGAIRMGRVAALPGNDLVSTASFEVYKRIALVDIQGDFGGDIVSRSGGIGLVTITRGSFRPEASITTFDGGIDSIIVSGGHFMGDVTSAEHIGTIQVLALDGFNGDLGVNPNLSQFIGFDAFRNQLPPGVAPDPTFQGPTIRAGTNITSIIVDSASMWETGIYARHAIGLVSIAGVVMNDNVTPGLAGSYIIAGDSINQVFVGGFAGGLLIHAGILDFGADDRPGGVGVDADTVKFGFINQVNLLHAGAVTVSAGGLAGDDGQYGLDLTTGTTDDKVANGRSAINEVIVRGSAVLSTVFADNGFGNISSNLIRTGPGQQQEDPGKVIEAVPATGLIPKGVPFAFTTNAGETGTILYTGSGDAYWDQSLGQLAIINSGFDTNLEVIADGGNLTDFHILSNDGASIGAATIRAALFGDSSFYFDGFVVNAIFGGVASTGFFGAGRDIGTMVFGPFLFGEIFANHIQNLVIGSDFGIQNEPNDAVMNILSAGNITVFEDIHGTINSRRDIASIAARDIDRGAIRSGRSIGAITARNVSESRISAFNDVLAVNLSGRMFDSFIYAGADLGSDAAFGGTGEAADRVSNGTINSVNIAGDFLESDISAGVLRGQDGFLGTADDVVAEGRSTIGTVVIGGSQVGSAFGSESYRIVSTGTIGSVTVAGGAFTQGRNLVVTALDTRPAPVEVLDLRTTEAGRTYTAEILFNQPIDSSTLAPALSIAEVRSGLTIPLTSGVDYSVTFDRDTNTGFITFATAITNRNLADAGANPAPGVYRITLDAEILRGRTATALLDGNGDGVGSLVDDFADEIIVGDAGDKLTQGVGMTTAGTNVDFYAPANLDFVFDANANANGLPDANESFTIRGTLGDHQDNNLTTFRIGGDVDLYSITLQAGQILRLGAVQGAAALASRLLLDATGAPVDFSQAVTLASGVLRDPTAVPGENILIKETGAYILAIASNLGFFDITDPTDVVNIPALAGASGAYNFTIEVFDDGDTGFHANTDAGNGRNVVNAPLPSDAGFDNGAAVTIANYTFFLNVGTDGQRNTADDIVSGSSTDGVFSQRTAGSDGIFGTTDDRRITSVSASIGTGNQSGAPQIIEPDVDVYHLNNGQTIAPGTLITVTLRLTEFGSNFGLTTEQDLRGDVQFGIFDTSGSTSIDDALLVAAPTDALPIGGQDARTTTDGVTAYGYDANGDFFITFVVPPRQDVSGSAPGTFALYVQGAIRSDYVLEVVTQGTRTYNKSSQNVLLETSGGVIEWLEAGGVETNLDAFSAAVAGFSGRIGVQTVDQYIISNLLSNLQDIFDAANVNITISADPLDFENQDHSTIFLTRSNAPAAFFNNETFGASEHVDAFNADRNDEGVVFAPSLAVLGNTPDQAGIDSFVDSLTAAVGRRIGELIGLRTQANTGGTSPVAIMAANSVENTPGGGGVYRFSSTDMALSASTDALTDTDFYLGRQNSVNLLDRILADRF